MHLGIKEGTIKDEEERASERAKKKKKKSTVNAVDGRVEPAWQDMARVFFSLDKPIHPLFLSYPSNVCCIYVFHTMLNG